MKKDLVKVYMEKNYKNHYTFSKPSKKESKEEKRARKLHKLHKKKEKNDVIVDKRIKKCLDDLMEFVRVHDGIIIPIAVPKEIVDHYIEKMEKKIKKYMQGKKEIFTEAFYEMLEENIDPADMEYPYEE